MRLASSVAWELRTGWAKGWRVSLSIDADETRVEGHVTTVSATGAFAVVGGLHVPLDRVLAVHRPSRLGDSRYDERDGTWHGRIPPGARRDPRQSSFPGL